MGGYAAHAVSVDSQIMRKYNAVDRYPRVDGKADSASPSTLCLIWPTFPEGRQHEFPQPSIMGGV